MFKKFVMSLFVACLLIAAPKADAHSSIDNLRAAAEKGDVEAQFKLGFLYSRDADSQSQDYEEAAKWYRKAAEQGHYGAQFSLGSFYAKGLGVRQDYGEAVKLFGKAAVQGHPLAAVHLGILHYKGLGSSRNFEEAYFWLRLSASQDPHVVGYRDGAQQKLTPSQLAKAEKRLHEWRYKPAAREDAEGQYRLG
ncbi:MAG: sel1 repeat family protein, partial [Micavibrio sp.]